MKIINLKCNNCGADLKINPKVKFFNCGFCYSSLAIKEEGNVIFSELLKSVKKGTNLIKVYSKILALEKEIDNLDKDWISKRKKYNISKDTSKNRVTFNLFILIFFSISFFVYLFMFSHLILAPTMNPFIFIPIICIIIILLRASNYINNFFIKEQKVKQYEQQRSSLLKNLTLVKEQKSRLMKTQKA